MKTRSKLTWTCELPHFGTAALSFKVCLPRSESLSSITLWPRHDDLNSFAPNGLLPRVGCKIRAKQHRPMCRKHPANPVLWKLWSSEKAHQIDDHFYTSRLHMMFVADQFHRWEYCSLLSSLSALTVVYTSCGILLHYTRSQKICSLVSQNALRECACRGRIQVSVSSDCLEISYYWVMSLFSHESTRAPLPLKVWLNGLQCMYEAPILLKILQTKSLLLAQILLTDSDVCCSALRLRTCVFFSRWIFCVVLGFLSPFFSPDGSFTSSILAMAMWCFWTATCVMLVMSMLISQDWETYHIYQ